MKKLIMLFMVALLISNVSPHADATANRYAVTREYAPYSDVNETDWYYKYAKLCYETNLMSGAGNNLFCPADIVSIQQGIVIVARLHQIYNSNPKIEDEASEKADWFSPYYDYCLKWKLLDESEYTQTSVMTREFFVSLLMRVFPSSEFSKINEIKSIPGYDTSSEIGQDVLELYNAGVLSGTNKYGVFAPYTPVNRAEIAALLCRIIRPDTRVAASLEPFSDNRAIKRAIPLNVNGLTITGFDGTYIYVDRPEAGRRGVFNLSGEPIIDCIKGKINEASGGMFRVEDPSTGEVTYYNTKGARLSQTSFCEGSDFSDGFAAVKNVDGAIQIIDTNGNIVRTLSQSSVQICGKSLSGGYLQPTDRPNVLINISTGKLFELPYSEISHFYRGTARVRSFGESTDPSANLIDANLNKLFLQEYTYIYWGNDYLPVTNDYSNWGVADIKGNLVVPMIYNSIESNGVRLGLFSRQGSLTLRSMATGEVKLELPTGKDSEYKLYDKFIIRLTNNHESSVASNGQVIRPDADEISVFDFNGYELFTTHDVKKYWLSENGLIYSDGVSLFYFNIS